MTTADSILPEAACTSTQFHVQTSPDQFAAYWNASQAISAVQLAVGANSPYLPRQGAVARDPDPAVRAGHRHPQRGAQGAGRAAAGVVRRALDHLGLRPVRGERPLLPGAAADHRRRGPARGARGRRHARSSPSCGCTTARSTAGTARSTTSPTACPHLRVENRVLAGRADGRRHDGQRRVLLRAGPRAGRERAAAVVADVVQRRGGELPRPPPSTASTPRSTGRASARCGPPSWSCAGCCRWPTRASTRGASTTDERDRLLGIIEQRCLTGVNGAEWFVDRMHAALRRGAATTRCARRCWSTASGMHTNEPVHTWD